LQMYEELDLTQYDVKSVDKYHYMVEGMHLAYADRGAYMGDPEYVDVPKDGLLHPQYVKERVGTIDLEKANPLVEPGDPRKYHEGERITVVQEAEDLIGGDTTD